MIHFDKHIFQATLQQWYILHYRDLPWRETKDPYKIWISEIILQQTRVNQGIGYYYRFIEKFPSITHLANANEEDVLKLWQGLGYYTRARNLHKAAKTILTQYNGVFPKEYKLILQLSGIGEYTAAAIASFAFGQNYAAVDGNVLRLLARISGNVTPINSTQGKREFQQIADRLLNKTNAAIHNQAMIEFGALQCLPTNPDCKYCVIKQMCKAYKDGTVDLIPVKIKKKNIRKRFFYYFHIQYKDFIYFQKRTNKDIWKNLYEFPLIELSKELTQDEVIESDNFRSLFGNSCTPTILSATTLPKHVLSHQHIFATFYNIVVDEESEQMKSFIRFRWSEIDHYPISRLTEKYLEIKAK